MKSTEDPTWGEIAKLFICIWLVGLTIVGAVAAVRWVLS